MCEPSFLTDIKVSASPSALLMHWKASNTAHVPLCLDSVPDPMGQMLREFPLLPQS